MKNVCFRHGNMQLSHESDASNCDMTRLYLMPTCTAPDRLSLNAQSPHDHPPPLLHYLSYWHTGIRHRARVLVLQIMRCKDCIIVQNDGDDNPGVP